MRDTESYHRSPVRIPDSLHLAAEELQRDISSLSIEPGRTVVAYCTWPDERTSARVAQQLRDLGYKDVRIMKGGLGSWTNAGLPLEANPAKA